MWTQHCLQVDRSIHLVGTLINLDIFLAAVFLLLLFAEAISKRQRVVFQRRISMKGFGYNNGELASWIEKRISHVVRVADYYSSYAYGMVQHIITPALVKILARFPFQPDTVNEWFELPQEDAGAVRISGDLYAMNMDKDGRDREVYATQHKLAFPDGLADEDHRVFFHGTSHKGAKSIISEGIDLFRGAERQDFSSGNGFYLNDKFTEALDFACKKKLKPAVLMFRFEKDVLDTSNGLELTGDDNKREWQNVVSKCRDKNLDRKFMKTLKHFDFIEGPMAKACNGNWQHPRQIENSYQLCVRSHDMAEKFDSSLHSVLFYSK